MDAMNLKDFHKKYYPKLSQGQLGALMGIGDPEFTLIKQQKKSKTSEAFQKAARYMKGMHNVILTYDSLEYKIEKEFEKQILKLQNRIAVLEEENNDLKMKLACRESLESIALTLIKIDAREEKRNKHRRKGE